ncbi:MAG: MTAP family purine nucleoside phosphorylase [Syntrophomonas sp.]
MEIPRCDFGFIGGSSTLSVEIPEALELDFVEIEARDLVFETPYGLSPEFKLLLLDNNNEKKRILSCKMHGWRTGVSRADASRQVFWVFKQSGIKRIVAEGGVGAVNYLLNPRDIVIPHDYMDFSMRKDVSLTDRYLLMMRDSLCPDMRKELRNILAEKWKGRVFDRSVYINTDGRHFESPAEVAMFRMTGGDIVGQSICPEVYLAREIGACYAGVYLVVNYAEGVVTPWQHEELAEIFHSESVAVGRIIFDFLRSLAIEQPCSCPEFRKDTLLKGVYTPYEKEEV